MIIAGDKTIKQPYVPVDGKWCAVKKESVMVNGEWRTVFEKKTVTYTINIYRYGSLYQTLTVSEGESVTLPSLGVGYATTSTSTTTTYNSGATITPTADIDLYAVYSYSIKIYRYGSLYQTLTSKSQASTASFTLPSLGVGFATTSGSTTVSYQNGAKITSASRSIYAVYQYSIKLYKYGTLYQTLTSKSQSSTAAFTLPTCTVDSGDDSFYGWSKTSGGTTRDYQSGASVTTSGMNLYAVFAYTAIVSTEYELVSTTNTSKTITVPVAGEITVGGAIHRSGTLNGVPSMGPSSITLNSKATAPYCKVGSTYISGTTGSDVLDASGQFPIYVLQSGISVSANTKITMLGTHETWGSANSYDYGNIYGIVEVKYPTSHTTGTKYRSSK